MLVRIQDIKAKKAGLLQTFFDYGDIFVQTAGELPNFEIESVPHPYESAKEITKLQQEALKKMRKQNIKELKEIPRI